MKKIFAAFLLVLLCLFSVACTEKETTSLTAKKDSFYLTLGGTVNLDNYVEKEGNGKLYYAVENPDVLKLDGSRVTGIAEGKGAVIIESGNFFVRIEVEVVDTKKIKVSVEDTQEEYDGKAHFPTVSGKIPEGSSVTYYMDGKVFTGAVEAGSYTVRAQVDLPDGYYADYVKEEAVLTVTPKVVNMSAVFFNSETYTFDGEEKTLTLTGTLPEGVTVRYENNVATEVGAYRAVAYFTLPDEKNYYPIDPYVADLVIKKKYVNLSAYGFAATTVTYDGKPHAAAFTAALPEGVSYEYYVKDSAGNEKKLKNDYSYTQSGDYPVYARLMITPYLNRNFAYVVGSTVLRFNEEGGKCVSFDEDFVRLTIKKADFSENYVWKLTHTVAATETDVTSVPYGKPFSFGAENEYSLRLVGASHGVNGEFPQGASVVYAGLAENNYGNIDSGKYTVRASFVMPDGADINYNTLETKYYSLTVDKATFTTDSFVFSTPTTEAVFDPAVYYNDFALDATSMPDFDDYLKVDYVYYINGNKIGEWKGENEIHSAGEYVLDAVFTVICADKKNYAAPEKMTLKIKITPVKIPSDLSMSDVKVTYDGEEHEIKVNGALPAGVGVAYTVGTESNLSSVKKVNAGVYPVTADFIYQGWEKVNYVLQNGDEEITSMQATLTIDKARVELLGTTADEKDPTKPKTQVTIKGTSVTYAQKEIPVYSDALTAGDIELTNNESGYIRYENAEEKARLLGSDKTSHLTWFDIPAIYNTDPVNYEDFAFIFRAQVMQKGIDLSGVTVPTQFVAYTGSPVEPAVLYEDEVSSFISTAVTSTGELMTVGKHLCTVTLAVKDANAYYLVGENVFSNVEIYIYDSSLYDYAPASSALTLYRGRDSRLTLPTGTKSIRAGAFKNASLLTSLTIPDTVESIADGALVGASGLSELSLPTYFSLNAVFRVYEVPSALEHVTVRNDTVVPNRAFLGQANLHKISYPSAVTDVGEYAFDGCSYLEEVEFGSVPSYGQGAFSGCKSLKELTVATFSSASYYFGTASKANYALETITVTSPAALINDAFSGLTSVQSIVFSGGVTSIGTNCFKDLNADIDLSSTGLTVTGEYAFAGFAGTLTLPSGLTTVSGRAFSGYTGSAVSLPKTVTSIGEYAFSGCRAAVTFASDAMITTIGTRAFAGYAGGGISLPSSVTSVGNFAFEQSDITGITLRAGMQIGEGAFKNCAKLASADLRVQTVSVDAFSGCIKLKELSLTGTVSIESNAFYNCGLTEVVFPSTLTSLGASAFASCPLSSVTMAASSVPSVKAGVFPTNRGIHFYVPLLYYTQYSDYIAATGCDMTKCTVEGVE